MCVRVDACRPGHHAGGRPLRTTAPHTVLPSTSIYSSHSGQGLTGGSARGPGGVPRVSVTVPARPRRQCRCCRCCCVLHLHVINNTSCYGVTQLARGRQHVYVARREQQLSVARSWRAIDGMHARTHCECVRDPGSSACVHTRAYRDRRAWRVYVRRYVHRRIAMQVLFLVVRGRDQIHTCTV